MLRNLERGPNVGHDILPLLPHNQLSKRNLQVRKLMITKQNRAVKRGYINQPQLDNADLNRHKRKKTETSQANVRDFNDFLQQTNAPRLAQMIEPA